MSRVGSKGPIDWDLAHEMWLSGESGEDIAVAVGAKRNTIYAAAHDRGWPRRFAKRDWAAGERLYREGRTVTEIAGIMECPVAAVSWAKHRYQWERPAEQPCLAWRCSTCLGINKSVIDNRICEYCHAAA